MLKNAGNSLKFFLAVLCIAVLVFAGLTLSKYVSALDVETTTNKAEFSRLKELEENQQQLNESLKLANFKVSDVENALPNNLIQERVLLDVYRAKYAVPDFNRASLQVSLPGVAKSVGSAAADGEVSPLKMLQFTVDFEATYEKLKLFILEMEKTPRMYKIVDVKISSGMGEEKKCTLTVAGYGLTANQNEKSIIEEYGFSWFSPTQKGKTNIFNLQTGLSDLELNQRIFDETYPSSYVKDFVLSINAKQEDLPSVTFQRHKGYNSIIGGEHYSITLNLVQHGEKYYYSYEMGDERYPLKDESQFQVYNGHDILIHVTDDADIINVPLLRQVTLTVNNGTDKTVRIIGDTSKRLRVIGDRNVIKQ